MPPSWTKQIPLKFVRGGQTDAFSEAGSGVSSAVWESRATGRRGGEASRRSLTEMPAQSGRAVVHSELDEGVQEVAVQAGELLPRADLLQVVRRHHEEVAECVERVEELQHQRDLGKTRTFYF